MPVQPAFEIDLTHEGHAVTLRASLRAAAAIDNHPEGFAGLVDQVSRQSLSAIRAVILATATDRREAHRFLAATTNTPLVHYLVDAQAACLAVMSALIPAGDDSADTAPSQGTTSGATMPLRAYFESLFDYATGWLGWTPADTWAASPGEIETAFKAHTDRLIRMMPQAVSSDTADEAAVYTPERLREIEELGFDPAFDRAALQALKGRF
ncbi:hypothetical protein [Paracoccus lutimaris]|uniref:Tail assembly chaperone n=1 Tax=Paracoccus lutimaris TaxID=1490030 RepID=A0A368YE77_9RHOB|nr:hypothetical protein [Paracoccus lutimaris]RCW78541.1 hypothetical protein DFP89_13616 [Paracoccus lutimaris]